MSVPSTIVKFGAIPGIHKAYVDYGYDLTTDIVVSFKHYTEGYRLTRRSSYSLSGVNVTHAELQALGYRDWETDRKSTRLNSSHSAKSRMPSSA